MGFNGGAFAGGAAQGIKQANGLDMLKQMMTGQQQQPPPTGMPGYEDENLQMSVAPTPGYQPPQASKFGGLKELMMRLMQ